MTLMRVRRDAHLALSADVRRALNVQEGDFLDAEVVQGGVLLTAVGTVARKRAWARIEGAVAQVVVEEDALGDGEIQAEEEAIAAAIRQYRRQDA